MTRLYGIPNCDSVKKARAALSLAGVAYAFVDFKKSPPSVAMLCEWLEQMDWQTLLNRKGTTWRMLSADAQNAVVDAASAVELMAAQPSCIKRPVVVWSQATKAQDTSSILTVGLPDCLAQLTG